MSSSIASMDNVPYQRSSESSQGTNQNTAASQAVNFAYQRSRSSSDRRNDAICVLVVSYMATLAFGLAATGFLITGKVLDTGTATSAMRVHDLFLLSKVCAGVAVTTGFVGYCAFKSF